MSFSRFDKQMMQRALFLAKKGQYSTKPNPAVGCVIVKNKKVVAEGWHSVAGKEHAEIEALNFAAEKNIDVTGATAYLTLEPCSHKGQTGPCSDALVFAGIAKVVIAMQDPNPLVCGAGIRKLQEANVKVENGCLQEEARLLNLGFIQVMEKKLPFVRLKIASSFDGRTAMSSGESKWITGEDSRKSVHFMRARHGAVITGIGTVLADDPSLTVRLNEEELQSINLTQENCHPLRIVLDPHLSMPLDAKMLDMPGRTIVMTSKITVESESAQLEKFQAKNIEVVAVAAVEDELNIESVLHYLVIEEQINDVMIESGSIVAGSFLKSGFVNEIHVFMAPILMGEKAKPMFTLPQIERMADKLEFSFDSCELIGEDVHFVLKPRV